MALIGTSRLGKTDILLNATNHQPDSGKINIYSPKIHIKKISIYYIYQFLINNREKVGLKNYNDPRAFIVYSNDMQDAYKNIEEYNPNTMRQILLTFDDMIAGMIFNQKLNPVVTKIYIRGRKLNIFLFLLDNYTLKYPNM